MLQRLACCKLSHDGIVACSTSKPRKSMLLEPRIDGPPRGKRYLIWMPVFSTTPRATGEKMRSTINPRSGDCTDRGNAKRHHSPRAAG